MSRSSLPSLLVSLLALGTARADPPVASYIFPAGGRVGTTVEVRVGGLNLPMSCPFAIHGPGVSADATLRRVETLWFEGPVLPLPDSQQAEDYPRDYAGQVRIANDAAPGVRHWRVWSAQGATSAKAFVVGALPELVEREVDGEHAAVLIRAPITVNGRIFPREDVDLWSFEARAGEPIRCEVNAARLGSPLDARLELFDPQGRRLTESDDALGDDPALQCLAPASGMYRVRIHDVGFRGGQDFVYRLTLTSRLAADACYPLGGRRGSAVNLELIGDGLCEETAEVRLPETHGDYVYRPSEDSPPLILEVDDLPEILEDEAEAASPVALPAVLNGRIGMPGDSDDWPILLRKGEAAELDLRAARLGSWLEARMVVRDAAGKEVARSEAPAGARTDPPLLRFTAPAEGTYLVRVEGRFRSRGGPRYAYRLRIGPPPAPDFRLTLAADTLALGRGAEGRLKIQAERTGGFSEPIHLEVSGLPKGVTVTGTEIPANQGGTELVFKAEATAPIEGAAVTVRGSATVGPRVAARPGPRGGAEVDTVLLAIMVPTPFKIVADPDFRWIPRGTVYHRRYRIERGGFAGPIEVRLADRQARHLQGVTGPTLVVPADASEFDYPVTLPPWMEIGRTSRTVVMGTGVLEEGDGRKVEVTYSSVQPNEQAIAVVGPGRLGLEADRESVTVAPGAPAKIHVRLARGKDLNGAATVRLVLPAHGQGIAAAPVEIPEGQSEATLEIRGEGSESERIPALVRATVMDHGEPVVAETGVGIHPRR
jgi:hypothetical protein